MWRISSLIMLFGMTDRCRPERIDNICSTRHEKRMFSGLGESGFFAVYDVRSNATGFGILEGCQAEIVSCPSCIISLTFSYMNLSCHCGSGFNFFLCSPRRSDYVWITEPSYESASGVPFCGVHPGWEPRRELLEYKSKTRTVKVSLFYTRSHTQAFTVDYKLESGSLIGATLTGASFLRFIGLRDVSETVAKEMPRPETDCGGFVGSVGGTITMRNVTHSREKLYHCIWLIQPLRNVLDVKRHLYLRITAFLNFAGDANVQVRRGLTSESPLLASLRHPISQNFREHVIPAKTGFYVSLRATFGPASHFAITYAAFSLDDCDGASEFLCENLRCISKKLICDGSDHCGDNSDESGLCYKGGNWHNDVTNYYFPRAKELSGSVVLLVSFVGLVCLLLVLATVAYCSAAKGRRQRDLEDQLQAIRDLRDSFSDGVSVENVVIDDPPSYESPPNYEDVMKMAVSTREVWACAGIVLKENRREKATSDL